MRHAFDVSRVVEAPAERAWDLLVKPARWAEWSSIRVIYASPRLRVGQRGRLRFGIGPWLPFVVTRLAEGRSWSWRVGGIPATGHRVEPLGPTRCRIVFEVPYLAWPYALVCWLALRRIAAAVRATIDSRER